VVHLWSGRLESCDQARRRWRIAPRPIKPVASSDRDSGSGTGARDALAWKPTSEPAPSVTLQIDVMEYGPVSDAMVSRASLWNESAVIFGMPGPAISVAPVQLSMLLLVVLTQLVNEATLAPLPVVTDPPIWLFNTRFGGAVGAV
jgi:hypothetical protein